MTTPTITLPPPSMLGLGERYSQWYPGQEESVSWLYQNPAHVRITGFNKPTGSGKSVDAVLQGVMHSGRLVILTPSKALQTQYMQTLARSLNPAVATMRDVRGQNSYQCLIDTQATVDLGPCHVGFSCKRKRECHYYAAVESAKQAKVAVTNPAYWVSSYEYGESEGLEQYEEFGTLVVDEADTLFDVIGSFLTTELEHSQVAYLGVPWPAKDGGQEQIATWAVQVLAPKVAQFLKIFKDDMDGRVSKGEQLGGSWARRKRDLEDLARAARRLTSMKGRWVITWGLRGQSFVAEPVDPGSYAEELVFRGIPRVILLSATLTEKHMEMLGCQAGDRDAVGGWEFWEFPGVIPSHRRPVIHVKTVAMSQNKANYSIWTSKIDRIVETRMDRKILLQTTSYDRRTSYMMGSRLKDTGILMSHDRRDVERVVAEFKRREPPCVLVSPSVVRGYDFPDDLLRCIIIGKVPYPSPSPVVQARREADPDYPAFQAMQSVQQEVGRGARNLLDWCEVLVVDDDWAWFSKKYAHFMSEAFRESVVWRTSDRIPEPPNLLTGYLP